MNNFRLRKSTRSLFCSLLLFWCSFSAAESALENSNSLVPQRLIFSALSGSPFNQMCAAIIREAYRQINFEVEFRYFPGKRTTMMSSSGRTDGETCRTHRVSLKFQELIKLDVPILSIDWHYYVVDKTLLDTSEEKLHKLKLGVIRGVLFTDEYTAGMDVIEVNSVKQIFELLLAKRVDAVIFSGFSGDAAIRGQFAGKNILKRLPAIRSEPVYHYLNQRHFTLGSRVSRVLKTMVESGQVDRMIQIFESAELRDL